MGGHSSERAPVVGGGVGGHTATGGLASAVRSTAAGALAVGQFVSDTMLHLFERTDPHLGWYLNTIPAGFDQMRPVLRRVWHYRAGDVFKVWNAPFGCALMTDLAWFGVFTEPSVIVEASSVSKRTSWGSDLHVQFVAQVRRGEWDFFVPPTKEPIEAGGWWRCGDGLELVPPGTADFDAFLSAVTVAVRTQRERHAREHEAFRAVSFAMLHRAGR